MEYLTGVPEVDALILDQMDDDILLNYCQTSSTNNDLCSIGRIQRRINNYKDYLNFDHSRIFDHLKIPCMLIKHTEYEDEDIYRNEVDIYILKIDQYYHVGYLGCKD